MFNIERSARATPTSTSRATSILQPQLTKPFEKSLQFFFLQQNNNFLSSLKSQVCIGKISPIRNFAKGKNCFPRKDFQITANFFCCITFTFYRKLKNIIFSYFTKNDANKSLKTNRHSMAEWDKVLN